MFLAGLDQSLSLRVCEAVFVPSLPLSFPPRPKVKITFGKWYDL